MAIDCIGCVYLKTCNGFRRKDDASIDCHIPEEGLRQLQREVMLREEFSAQDYSCITSSYIDSHKAVSSYWLKEKNKLGSIKHSK